MYWLILFLISIAGILAIKYTFITIELFYMNPSVTNSKNDHRNWYIYCVVMVGLSPYLLLLEVYPALKDKWILAHKNSINRVFLN